MSKKINSLVKMNLGPSFDKASFNEFLKRNKSFLPDFSNVTISPSVVRIAAKELAPVSALAPKAIAPVSAKEITPTEVAPDKQVRSQETETFKEDDDDEMSFEEKAGIQVGKRVAGDARAPVRNLRANYGMKHKGSLEELQEILNKSSTKRDWALSQLAFQDDAFENLETEAYDRWSGVAESHHEAKMHHIVPKDPEAAAAKPGTPNKNLRLIEMVDSKTGDITIAFAGLGEGVEELLLADRPADLAFSKVDFVHGKGGKVSKPIFEIYDNLRPTIMEILEKYDGKVKFVGHSLGGALAEMAGADTGLGIKNVSVTAFAPPPFGDADFVNAYPDINLNRFGNKYDPVMFKLGFGSRHPTSDMWDITHLDAKRINDKFWFNPVGNGGALLEMTHQSPGLEKGFVDAMFDPDLLENVGRQKGDAVFNSKVIAFLDALDLGLKAASENAFAAFKEFFKASGGDMPYFKDMFVGDTMEKVSKVINIDNIDFELADFDIIDASDINVFDDITQIPDLEDLDLDDILKKVGEVGDDLDTSGLLKGIKTSDRVTPITRPVLKNLGTSINKTPILKASRNVVKQLATKAKAAKGLFLGAAKTSAAATKAAAKGILKGLGKAIDVGVLDAVFIGLDIAEDFERIDDESVFTMWNGVPVHKLYNPDEYAYIEALKVIYNMQGIDSIGVSVDNFINTWFGRISESEDGSFLIDGEDKGMNYLRNGFEYGSSLLKSDEGVQTESKASAAAENTAKGIFGFLIGAAVFTAAAIAAPATGGGSLVAAAAIYGAATATAVGASVALEAADEHFEQAQIGERANNFNQAFHRKILNDNLDFLNSKILEVFGPLLKAEHSVIWHKELINAALVEKHPGALGKLEEFGYPRHVLESIGKIVRSHIPRMVDMEITSETKLADIIDNVTSEFESIDSKLGVEYNLQKGLNVILDEIYEKQRADLNGDLNRLWEILTDTESGLSIEEIKETAKKANEIISLKHVHKRGERNELITEADEELAELIESTEERVEDRKDLQKEINRLNEQLEKAKGELEDERNVLKESADDLEKIAGELKDHGVDLASARDVLEKARNELDEARGDLIEARDDLKEDRENLLEVAEDLNRRRREFVELQIKEREKEFNEIMAEQEEKIENVKSRQAQRLENKQTVGQEVNLDSGKIEDGGDDVDRGLPEREDEGKFEPTGRELAFTFDNGAPRMLFENGEEKSYEGPSNALAGGITQGNWTGVIPNANRAPVNLLDNYFMAYHIENQTDQTIANGRLVQRLTRALNKKKISPEINPIEYRVTLITLEHIKRYKNIFGIEISNSFMENGLGAIIRDQVYENITVPLRKGALPASFKLSEGENISMDIDADMRVNLKRARDIAFAGGDTMMGAKFQRIQAEFNDMARVAGEYIGAARDFSQGVNISRGMDRLVLENMQKVEQKEDGIAKLLVSLLNKPLIQIIQ